MSAFSLDKVKKLLEKIKRKNMKQISSIQLYRYNIGSVEETFHIEYIAMDYFDAFLVKEENDVIHGCIGNQREVQDNYLALQELCFTGEEAFKQPDEEKMFLTLIQIFIHPNFWGVKLDGKNQEIENILKTQMQEFQAKASNKKRKIECQLFFLFTAGDYLISVRSNDIHAAFEFSTTLRELYFVIDNEKYQFFTTYSIVGMRNTEESYITESDQTKEVLLMDKDLVSVRGIYSDEYRRGETKEEGTNEEYQLYGRYDYSIDIRLKDFIKIRHILMAYKQEGDIDKENLQRKYWKIKRTLGKNAKALITDIFSNKLDYWNERILLKKIKKEENEFTEFRETNAKCMYFEGELEPLKKRNEKQYRYCMRMLRKIEEESSIKEKERVKVYYELLERLLKISKNLNYQRELRLHVAILFRQTRYLVESLMEFRKYYKDPMEFDDYERDLIAGIKSLDAFAGYIRNINLQTLQAPNYNLQINGSIEKILMAYDWFITHVLQSAKIAGKNQELYHVSRDLCPVLIPRIEGKDQSVEVLFELSKRTENQEQRLKNLMVVFVPNVESMEKYESYIPILCHELLSSYVLSIFCYSVFCNLFSECRDLFSTLKRDEMLKLIQEQLASSLFGMGTNQYMGDLKYFEHIFQEKLVSFCKCGNYELETYFGIHDFIRNTQDDVLEYNTEYFACVENISQEEKKIKGYLKKGYNQMKKGEMPGEELLTAIENGRRVLNTLCKEYACIIVISHCKQINVNISFSKSSDEIQITEEVRKIIQDKQKEMNPSDIQHHKAVHNCWWQYRDVRVALNRWNADKLLEEYFYYQEKKVMAKKIFEKAEETLSIDTDMNVEWQRDNKSRMKIELLKNQLGIAQKDVDKFEHILKNKLADYNEKSIQNMSEMNFSIYREVASDLFMCGMFELSIFGYLQFTVTHFRFEGDERTRFNVQRCKMVCQAILGQKKTMQYKGIGEVAFKKFAQRIKEEYAYLERENPSLWIYLQSDDFLIQKLENILDILREQLYMIDKKSATETTILLYTKMYRFCKLLRLLCEQKNYGMDEDILTDFVSEGSFFEENQAKEIRKYVFLFVSIRKQITERWNDHFIIDDEKAEKDKKEQKVYAEFLKNCYRKCQNDIRNWENSK